MDGGSSARQTNSSARCRWLVGVVCLFILFVNFVEQHVVIQVVLVEHVFAQVSWHPHRDIYCVELVKSYQVHVVREKHHRPELCKLVVAAAVGKTPGYKLERIAVLGFLVLITNIDVTNRRTSVWSNCVIM